jgi:hypothetical protein
MNVLDLVGEKGDVVVVVVVVGAEQADGAHEHASELDITAHEPLLVARHAVEVAHLEIYKQWNTHTHTHHTQVP